MKTPCVNCVAYLPAMACCLRIVQLICSVSLALRAADTAPEASWDETAPAGEAVAAEGGDWGAAPAPGGFEAAAAPAAQLQYQQPDQFATGY